MKNIIRGFVELRDGIESNLLRMKFCYVDLKNGSRIYLKKEDQEHLNFTLNFIYKDYIENLLETEERWFNAGTHRGLPRGTTFEDVKEKVVNKLLLEVSLEEALQKYIQYDEDEFSLFTNNGNTYFFKSDYSYFNWTKLADKFLKSNLECFNFSYLREVFD